MHAEAFEYYLALGAKRSYKAVAEKFGCSVVAVQGWASSFGWKDRVLDRERQIIEEMVAFTNAEVVKTKLKYGDIISEAIEKAMKDNVIQIKSVDDFVKMVKTHMLLLGENTDNLGVDDGGGLEGALKRVMGSVASQKAAEGEESDEAAAS
jgi:uncharacterized protein YjcR